MAGITGQGTVYIYASKASTTKKADGTTEKQTQDNTEDSNGAAGVVSLEKKCKEDDMNAMDVDIEDENMRRERANTA